jgi:hypothetical protein
MATEGSFTERLEDGWRIQSSSVVPEELADLAAMVDEFAVWGRTFAPNPVAFQVGYPADGEWWRALGDPLVELVDRALARSDVRMVAARDLVSWLEDPVTLG